ncbi:hypothetical protein Q3G72_005519 [Acer saccharum]|nr:hypothetical protein Q3G72_005519 [Acer saccharum]
MLEVGYRRANGEDVLKALDKLEKDLSISVEMAAKLKRILMTSGDFSAEELGDKIKEYGIVAPNTKNLLSDAFQLT